MLMFAGPAGISFAQTVGPAAKAATSQPQPQQKEFYRYNPEGRIDPFRPFVDLDAAAKKKPEKSKALPLNPLQRQGIEQYRLVGVIEGDRGRHAMVQDASGKFYAMIKGSYIGLNRGRVTEILKDSVVIQERITTDEGKVQSRRQILKLRQDEVKP